MNRPTQLIAIIVAAVALSVALDDTGAAA